MSKTRAPSSRLRQSVVIEQPNFTSDFAGGETVSWSSLVTVWAEIMPLRPVENFESLQRNMIGQFRITLRYRADVTTRMRVNENGRIFYIRSLMNVGDADELLELICEEGEPR